MWLDWVPGHFPTDAHGLGRFDGTALYEHADPREGFHRDWNTLIYNFGRREVANFLLSSARYWVDAFHADGLRVDAVASMLYLDYSRPAGEWVPNEFGGRENLAAIAFLKRMNELIFAGGSGATTAAEEIATHTPMQQARPPGNQHASRRSPLAGDAFEPGFGIGEWGSGEQEQKGIARERAPTKKGHPFRGRFPAGPALR